MRTWKLTIEYDGTRYSGWQEQRNARTVAGEIKAAAEDLLRADVELQGAGRTDAGVHAAAQVAHLRADAKRRFAPGELIRELNQKLPADIALLGAEEVSNRFHARHDALSRRYVYQIATKKSAFNKKYVWWIKDPLNTDAMSKAAETLVGRHDFRCFRAADPSRPGESTIVVVDRASVEVEEGLVAFRIEASHFLWRMVRRLTGTIVKLGLGEITEADFAQLLNAQCTSSLDVAAWTAPASGLFLEEVIYPDFKSKSQQ
jgi:tRNA pseudouridine38-40 synthase